MLIILVIKAAHGCPTWVIQRLWWWARGKFGNSLLPWSQGDLSQGLRLPSPLLEAESPSFYPSKSPGAPENPGPAPRPRLMHPSKITGQETGMGWDPQHGKHHPKIDACPYPCVPQFPPGWRSDTLGFIPLQHPLMVPLNPSTVLDLLLKAF